MNAPHDVLGTINVMGTSADGFIVMVTRKDGLCINCGAAIQPGTTVSWHPTRRQLRCRHHGASTRTATQPVEVAPGSHPRNCSNIDPEHLIDIVAAHGHRALEHRRKPRSTATFDQIVVVPTGVIIVEHVPALAPDTLPLESTIAARLLRKVEAVRHAIADETTQVRGVAVVGGFDGTSSLFGVTLTGRCPGWLFPTEGPLGTDQIARVAAAIGDAFPASR
jgi:hypothetical protein